MVSQWDMKADDWMVRPSSFSATIFYGRFRMALYSRDTGFFADVSMNGTAGGLGGNTTSDATGMWFELDVSRSFSPNDLHGAPGSLKFGGVGIILGVIFLLGSAKLKGSKEYLFKDACLDEGGLGLGASAGYVSGQWKIDQVWSNAGVPGSQPQAATESVGGGDARPTSSGMSETG